MDDAADAGATPRRRRPARVVVAEVPLVAVSVDEALDVMGAARGGGIAAAAAAVVPRDEDEKVVPMGSGDYNDDDDGGAQPAAARRGRDSDDVQVASARRRRVDAAQLGAAYRADALPPPPSPPVPPPPPAADPLPPPVSADEVKARVARLRDKLAAATDPYATAQTVAVARSGGTGKPAAGYRAVRAALFARKTDRAFEPVDDAVFDAFATHVHLVRAFASGRLFAPAPAAATADSPAVANDEHVTVVAREARLNAVAWCRASRDNDAPRALFVPLRGLAVLYALGRLEAARAASEVAEVSDVLYALLSAASALAAQWGVPARQITADNTGAWVETLRAAQRAAPRMAAALDLDGTRQFVRTMLESAQLIIDTLGPVLAPPANGVAVLRADHPARRWPRELEDVVKAANDAKGLFEPMLPSYDQAVAANEHMRDWFDDARRIDDAALQQMGRWADASQRLGQYALQLSVVPRNVAITSVIDEVAELHADLLANADIERGRVFALDLAAWVDALVAWNVQTLCIRRRTSAARGVGVLVGDAGGAQAYETIPAQRIGALDARPRNDDGTIIRVVAPDEALPAAGPPASSRDTAATDALRQLAAEWAERRTRYQAIFEERLARVFVRFTPAGLDAADAEWAGVAKEVESAWHRDDDAARPQQRRRGVAAADAQAETLNVRWNRVHRAIRARAVALRAPIRELERGRALLTEARGALTECKRELQDMQRLLSERLALGPEGTVVDQLRDLIQQVDSQLISLRDELEEQRQQQPRQDQRERLFEVEARLDRAAGVGAQIDAVERDAHAAVDIVFAHVAGINLAVRRVRPDVQASTTFMSATGSRLLVAAACGTLGARVVTRYRPSDAPAAAGGGALAASRSELSEWAHTIGTVYPLFVAGLCVDPRVLEAARGVLVRKFAERLDADLLARQEPGRKRAAGRGGGGDDDEGRPFNIVADNQALADIIERATSATGTLRALVRAAVERSPLAGILELAKEGSPQGASACVLTVNLIRACELAGTELAGLVDGARDARDEGQAAKTARAGDIVARRNALVEARACARARVDALKTWAETRETLERMRCAATAHETLGDDVVPASAPSFDAQRRAVAAWTNRVRKQYTDAVRAKDGHAARLRRLRETRASAAAAGNSAQVPGLDAALGRLDARIAEAQLDVDQAQQAAEEVGARERFLLATIAEADSKCAVMRDELERLRREEREAPPMRTDDAIEGALGILLEGGARDAREARARFVQPAAHAVDEDIGMLGDWSVHLSIAPEIHRMREAITALSAAQVRGDPVLADVEDVRERVGGAAEVIDQSVIVEVERLQLRARREAAASRVRSVSLRRAAIASIARAVKDARAEHDRAHKSAVDTRDERASVVRELETRLRELGAPEPRGVPLTPATLSKRWDAARETERLHMARSLLDTTHPADALEAGVAAAKAASDKCQTASALLGELAEEAKSGLRAAKAAAASANKAFRALERRAYVATAAMAYDAGGDGDDGDDDGDDDDADADAQNAPWIDHVRDDADVSAACRIGHDEGSAAAQEILASVSRSESVPRRGETKEERDARLVALVPPGWLNGAGDEEGRAHFRALADAVSAVPRVRAWNADLVATEPDRLYDLFKRECLEAKRQLASGLQLAPSAQFSAVLSTADAIYGDGAAALPEWQPSGAASSHAMMRAYTRAKLNAPVFQVRVEDLRFRQGVAGDELRDAMRNRDDGRIAALAGIASSALRPRGESTRETKEALNAARGADNRRDVGARAASAAYAQLSAAVAAQRGPYNSALRKVTAARRDFESAQGGLSAALREAEEECKAIRAIPGSVAPGADRSDLASIAASAERTQEATTAACELVRDRMKAKLRRLDVAKRYVDRQISAWEQLEQRHRGEDAKQPRHTRACLDSGPIPRAKLDAARAFIAVYVDTAQRANVVLNELVANRTRDATSAVRRAKEATKDFTVHDRRANTASKRIRDAYDGADKAARALDAAVDAAHDATAKARAAVQRATARLAGMSTESLSGALPPGGVAALLGGQDGAQSAYSRVVTAALEAEAQRVPALAAFLRVPAEAAGDRRVRPRNGAAAAAPADAEADVAGDAPPLTKANWDAVAQQASSDAAIKALSTARTETSASGRAAAAADDAAAARDSARAAKTIAHALWTEAKCGAAVPPLDVFSIAPLPAGGGGGGAAPYTDAYTLDALESKFVAPALRAARQSLQACDSRFGARGAARSDPDALFASFIRAATGGQEGGDGDADEKKQQPPNVSPVTVVSALNTWLRYATQVRRESKALRKRVEVAQSGARRERSRMFARNSDTDTLEALLAGVQNIPGCAVPADAHARLLAECESACATAAENLIQLRRTASAFAKARAAADAGSPVPSPRTAQPIKEAAASAAQRIQAAAQAAFSRDLAVVDDWDARGAVSGAGISNSDEPASDDGSSEDNVVVDDDDDDDNMRIDDDDGDDRSAAGSDAISMNAENEPASGPEEPVPSDEDARRLFDAFLERYRCRAPVAALAAQNAQERTRLEEIQKIREELDANASPASDRKGRGRRGGGGDNADDADLNGFLGRGGRGGQQGDIQRRALPSIMPHLLAYMNAPRDALVVTTDTPLREFNALRQVCVELDAALKQA